MHKINLFKAENLQRYEKQENYKGAALDLSKLFEAKKLGFHLEVIDPKNFSCPYHFHEQDEELFIVIEGEAIIRCNDRYLKVVAGDLFFYPVGSQYAHNIHNHTDKPFKFFALSNESTEYDVCHYPDSNKKTSEKCVLQNGEIVSYFKDEEDPAKYWAPEALRGEVD